MKNIHILILLVLISSLVAQETNSKRKKYALIIHKENAYPKSKNVSSVIKQLFLKTRCCWPHDSKLKAIPLLRSKRSKERKVLLRILNMTPTSFNRHWSEQKQRYGKVSPRSVRSDRLLIMFVSRKKGAFGIVPIKKIRPSDRNVKILMTFGE